MLFILPPHSLANALFGLDNGMQIAQLDATHTPWEATRAGGASSFHWYLWLLCGNQLLLKVREGTAGLPSLDPELLRGLQTVQPLP